LDKEISDSKLRIDNAHILLVDDEAYLVRLWKRVIESRGYKVTSFTSGLEALEAVRESPDIFDIVITDQSMPEITGLELAEEIMKICSNLKIILCSGYLGDIDLNNEINQRIDVILQKPFDSNALIEAIESVLNNIYK